MVDWVDMVDMKNVIEKTSKKEWLEKERAADLKKEMVTCRVGSYYAGFLALSATRSSTGFYDIMVSREWSQAFDHNRRLVACNLNV